MPRKTKITKRTKLRLEETREIYTAFTNDTSPKPEYQQTKTQNTKQRKTQPPEPISPQFYTSEEDKVSTKTSYINRNGNNDVVIWTQPKEEPREIYSILITTNRGIPFYKINKDIKNGEAPKIFLNSKISKLYHIPWITGNKAAENQLSAIERTIQAHQENIEKHLGTKL
ncbi:MAG: hypothetical protein KKB59_18915 [Spirochaetes bacterium]|nr:hypothetical protein [Spirochaetota bacterium]